MMPLELIIRIYKEGLDKKNWSPNLLPVTEILIFYQI